LHRARVLVGNLGPALALYAPASIQCNVIVKFANDTYLLVGSNHLSTATEEFEHISAWAMKNNLHLNPNKTRELIVVRKGQKSITCPRSLYQVLHLSAPSKYSELPSALILGWGSILTRFLPPAHPPCMRSSSSFAWPSSSCHPWGCQNDHGLVSNVCLPGMVGIHSGARQSKGWTAAEKDEMLRFSPTFSPNCRAAGCLNRRATL